MLYTVLFPLHAVPLLSTLSLNVMQIFSRFSVCRKGKSAVRPFKILRGKRVIWAKGGDSVNCMAL